MSIMFTAACCRPVRDGLLFIVCGVLSLLYIPAGFAASPYDGVKIRTEHVNGSVHMLIGAGGNIAVSTGKDGTLMVDDQFAPMAKRIQRAIRKLGGSKPRFVLNTHHHGDHVGGNAYFARKGTIIAHRNVYLKLLGNSDIPPSALPVITLREHLEIRFNGDEIEVLHLPRGHTDGDIVVWFKKAKVIHMGDLLFNGKFPFIDINAGGSVHGYMNNIQTVIDMIPDDTKVIPGHGELGDVAALKANLNMIRTTYKQVGDALSVGTSVEDLIATGLGSEWAEWSSNFITEAFWIQTLAMGYQQEAVSRSQR